MSTKYKLDEYGYYTAELKFIEDLDEEKRKALSQIVESASMMQSDLTVEAAFIDSDGNLAINPLDKDVDMDDLDDYVYYISKILKLVVTGN